MNANNTRRNLMIFVSVVLSCGWLGYCIDRLMGRDQYLQTGTLAGEEPLGMLIWLISPLLAVILLRTLGGEGWKNSGFALHLRRHKTLYLLALLIYPAVTALTLVLGIASGGLRFNTATLSLTAYLGLFATQLGMQFVKNIFEESVWRGYLTHHLLERQWSDWKIYFGVGVIWWLWHLPYVLIFLPESEIMSVLPVGRVAFFAIGMIVVICWTVMYTEIYRMTRSIWPLVIMHTLEDAIINPLLIHKVVEMEGNAAFIFSLSVGLLPTALYLAIGLALRRWRLRQTKTD